MRKQQEELAVYKDAARNYGLKVSLGSVNSGPLKPPASVKRDAWSVYKWMVANGKA
jgi:sugar phosphate isomerase/epimerase